MTFQVKRLDLLHAVTVCAAVMKRGESVLCKQLSLDVDYTFLTIQGRNGSKFARFKLPLNEQPADNMRITCLSVDGRKLIQSLRVIHDELVTIEITGKVLKLIGKNARQQELSITLVAEIEEGLAEPTVTGGEFHDIKVSRELLIKGLAAVRFCCDCESTRYPLAAVSMQFKKGQIEFAATDSRLLSVALQECIQGSPARSPELHLLWNCYFVDQLLMVLQSSNSPTVTIHSYGQRLCQVSADNWCFTDSCTEGRFPRYMDVFPKTLVKHSIFHVSDLRAAIATCRVMTSKQLPGVLCALVSDGLSISCRMPDGEAKVKAASLLVGEIPSYQFIIDNRFLDQWLATLPKSGMVEMHLGEEFGAIHFKSDGGTDYIIMPLDPDYYEGRAA